MKDFITIFKYTFYENLRKKAFIISTIVTLVIIIAAVVAGSIIVNSKSDDNHNSAKGGASNSKSATIYLVDKDQVVSKDIQQLKAVFKNYDIILKNEDEISEIKKQVKVNEKKMLMVVSKKNDLPYIDYYVKNGDTDIDTYSLTKSVKNIYSIKLLKTIKADQKISQLLLQDIPSNVNELKKAKMQNFGIAMIACFIIFYGIYFYSYSVAASVSSEKSSRVMELLVTSTKPSKIILGKSFAVGLLGLCQLILTIVTSLISVALAFPNQYKAILKGFASNSVLVLAIIVIYFILGYFIYAMINAVVGATVSKAEDLQSAIMPISIITVIAFYMGYISVFNSDGKLALISSIIPLTSPFTIPCRLLISEVPTIQLIASIAVMIITIVIVTVISIKLYSRAVLHYGGRLKLGKLFKMRN